MSIDFLHEKIRKFRNPLIVDLCITEELLPPHLMEQEGDFSKAYIRFCRELLEALAGAVPGVRFSFDAFALLGDDGLTQLRALLNRAGELGFYTLLDGPQILSPWAADRAAAAMPSSLLFPPARRGIRICLLWYALPISPHRNCRIFLPACVWCRVRLRSL